MEVAEREEKTLKFWKKNKIFEKSVETPAGKKPKGNFIFNDGPPFITGLPHYGTLLTSIPKDVVPRFWTMNGFKVERKWGWDCHGLPAENQVEKELGLKTKKDIENLGIGKFVSSCKSYVNNVSSQWDWYIDRIARWVNMDNAYRTMNLDFMESVIWGFKEIYDKNLIFEDFRSSLHCPRCATPLSKFEITMDSGSYKDVTELSVVVKFKLKREFQGNKNVSVLAWTTTPWTLPGNLALAVNKKIPYVLVEMAPNQVGPEEGVPLVKGDVNTRGRKYILAKERVKDILKENLKVIKEFSGKELIGLEFESLFDLKNEKISENKNSYKILSGDFVSVEDGTGVVHIAPNFGEDDFEIGKKENLPIVELMNETGTYTEEAGEWAGMYFKDAGKKVLEKLGDKLFSKFNYTHSYPFCYRCQTPLIYKTQKAWYLNVDKIRKNLLKTNEKINWVPDYFKEGRFKYNLETAPQWCLSRSRYWGTPIPIWKCEKCDELKVAGSIKEIEKLSGKKITDLHRPKIDDYFFKCKCGGKMKRVPEVLDCWFESGSMPHAQWHYPFERKNDLKKIFPADFIIEYTGQLRGWFYTLHVISNAIFNSESFKNVVCHGVLAGTDGRKMSKSYGNYPDPKITLEKYGGDAIRMYFLTTSIFIGGDINLSEKEIQDSLRKNVMLFSNVCKFYEMAEKTKKVSSDKNTLDKWIVSRLHELIEEVTENMKKYDLPSATKPITKFIDDLSTVYLKQNRERINDGDSGAIGTLKEVLEISSKVFAPFMPFVAEDVWQKITGNNFTNSNKSVHLEAWPKFDKKLVDKKLVVEMELVREIISLGLRMRDQEKIGLKWPLAKAVIFSRKLEKELEEIIKSQLNVKEIKWEKSEDLKIEFDTKMTHELEAEGYAREMSRHVQSFRKQLGLVKKDKIELFIIADEKLKNILEKQKDFIKDRTNSKKLEFVTTGKERFKKIIEFKIRDKRGWIAII